MIRDSDDIDWSLTTWEGSRRANIRQWLRLTVRERFEAVEDAGEFVRYMEKRREEREAQSRTEADPRSADAK